MAAYGTTGIEKFGKTWAFK